MAPNRSILLLVLSVAAAAGVRAQESPYDDPPVAAVEQALGPVSPWWFRVAPYVWLAGVGADVAVGGIDATLDGGPGAPEVAAMGVVEVGRGKWSISLDGVYAGFSGDADGGGEGWDSLGLDGDQFCLTTKLNYRAMDSTEFSLLVFLGARLTDVGVDLALRGPRGARRTLCAGDEWTDPVVGLRGRSLVAGNCYLGFSGELGGFGVGSDFVWQAFVGLGWQPMPACNAVLGYRGLGGDRSADGFSFDSVAHGPVVGIEFAF